MTYLLYEPDSFAKPIEVELVYRLPVELDGTGCGIVPSLNEPHDRRLS